jgi:hypothetical protein
VVAGHAVGEECGHGGLRGTSAVLSLTTATLLVRRAPDIRICTTPRVDAPSVPRLRDPDHD